MSLTPNSISNENIGIRDEKPGYKEEDSLSWTLETTSCSVRSAEYAVRGKMSIAAEQLEERIQGDSRGLPFNEIVKCNIGNPQNLGQKPVTYLRQLASLVECPWLLNLEHRETVLQLYPIDVIERAESTLKIAGSVGAYSNSQGLQFVRENVAKFISERDGVTATAENIFLTSGASGAVAFVLQCLIDSPNDGIMVPVPQYPLYTATIALNNGRCVPYYLDEASGWCCETAELERAHAEAVTPRSRDSVNLRAIVVINPGNPTGGVLSEAGMQQIILFAVRHRLVLMADEVYQDNIHAEGATWKSFRRVLHEMPSQMITDGQRRAVQIASFHSVSKGVLGECGRRGGYVELHNVPAEVLAQIYKLASISLCTNVQGQIAVDVLVKPPAKEDPSYAQYTVETQAIAASLRSRAHKLCAAFNQMPGICCTSAAGAMYLFPQIVLSRAALHAAQVAGIPADTYYTLSLLNATGICVVPGSGFLQKSGTFHFRTTFLPSEDKIDSFIEKFQRFHVAFMEQYSDQNQQIIY